MYHLADECIFLFMITHVGRDIWMFLKVVGSIDQMELDDPDNSDKNSGSIPDSKSVVRSFDAEKSKGKRKLYVGSQALGYRRDHMEVRS